MFKRNGNNRLENLGDLRVFAELARLGSLSAAARLLGITPAGASKRLRRLEEVLGARLVNRTTRKVGLTEDGRAFLGHCINVLAELDAADEALGNHQGPLRGRLRVTAPASFGRKHVAPALPDLGCVQQRCENIL